MWEVKTSGKPAARSGKRDAQVGAVISRRRAQGAILSRAALDFLLGETITFLLAAGLSRKSLATELRKEASRIGTGGRLRRSKAAKVIKEGHENLVEIAGVIHDWHRQSVYTDRRSGEPRALRAHELRKLIGRRFPYEKIASALQWMVVNGIIRQRTDRLYVVSMGRQVLLRNHRKLAMERAAALVPQYLRISLRNADTSEPRSRDIDRDARVFFLPEKWVGLWRTVARERTQAFLEGIDNWLEDHTRPEEPGPVREVAIHCYGYTGEPRSPKPGGTNIGRLEGDVQ
jgi:hypothetical protein